MAERQDAGIRPANHYPRLHRAYARGTGASAARERETMATRTDGAPGKVYQIKVTLKDSKPPIWRRLLVAADTPLETLHVVLQIAFGWINSHLHQFKVSGEFYSPPVPWDDGIETLDSRKFTLAQLAPEVGSKLVYEYDFGDFREHVIVVEKALSPDEAGEELPVVVTGRRAGPPEDCGGVWGYDDVLEALADPEHPKHEEMKEWVPEGFDPEAFSADEINARLRQAFRPRRQTLRRPASS
jgi:hypothetical protein